MIARPCLSCWCSVGAPARYNPQLLSGARFPLSFVAVSLTLVFPKKGFLFFFSRVTEHLRTCGKRIPHGHGTLRSRSSRVLQETSFSRWTEPTAPSCNCKAPCRVPHGSTSKGLLVLIISPTAESFGVSAQIGSGVVRGGPEVRFYEGSTRVPLGFHQGSTRVPRGSAGWCEQEKKHRMLLGISPELIICIFIFFGGVIKTFLVSVQGKPKVEHPAP